MNNIYNEWFNNRSKWFANDKIIDEYLCNKYLKYINNTNKILEFKEFYSKETLISCILLLDQIPRHYKRLHEDINIIQYSYDAIKFSNYVLSIYEKILTIDELFFVYLPFRHVKDISKIHEIINIFISIYNNSNELNKTKCKRYIYATINNIYSDINETYVNNTLIVKKFEEIDQNIFDKNSLIQKKVSTNNNIIFTTVKNEYIKLKNNCRIIVSLSGGVDSIVALHIIKKITNNVIAVHINYNNRIESTDELEFVNYFCNMLDVKLVYRTITEISRCDCLNNGLRDIYEELTKKIRYNMYEKISDNNTYVLLGHNKDDCFENIITNITNKNNYDNLSGMEILKSIDSINFWRPMLNVKKVDIVKYANNNNIPYLFDSTPIWSVRGKIRDNLKPVLSTLKTNNNNHDESQIESFFALKDAIRESTEIINNVIIDNLVDKIEYKDNILYALYSIKDLYIFRYKSVFKIFLSKLNIYIRNKTLYDLIEYVDRYILTDKEKVFILNKNYTITFKKTNDNSYKKLIITYLNNELNNICN